MKTPALVLFLSLLVLSLLAGALNLSSTAAAPPQPDVAAQGAPSFTSVYSPLTKCGSGMTKKEEKEAEDRGSDIPSRCKGFGGYTVHIFYSACSSNFSIEKGDENIALGMQAINFKQKTVEWRMANGKPFAIIMRSFEYAGNDLCSTAGKVTKESLIVKGLKGFENIDETIDAGTPGANLKAREIADKGYVKQ